MTTTEHSGTRPGIVILVALGCLLVGSSGGAVAGSLITGKDVKDGSLTGKDIKDKSLKSEDLDPDALGTGPQGAPGAPGAKGDKGDKGDTGLTDFQTVSGDPVNLANTQTTIVEAHCPVNYAVLGGGGGHSSVSGVVMLESRPFQFSAGVREWIVKYTNNSGSAASVFAVATCAKVAG